MTGIYDDRLIAVCAFCLADLPAADMCRHGRWLCATDCDDYCLEDR